MTSRGLFNIPSAVGMNISNDENQLLDDLIQDEVDGIKEPPVLSRGSDKENFRASESSTVDIESVIVNFNKELDNLTRSFNLLTSSQRQASTSFQTPRYQQNRSSNLSSNSRRTVKDTPYTYQTPSDPPTSKDKMSPLRFSSDSTPQRYNISLNHDGFIGNDVSGISHPSEAPPQPVETPANSASGTPDRIRNSSRRNERYYSSSKWEVTLDRMKDTLAEQERIIRELQIENDDLKRQLMVRERTRRDDFSQQFDRSADRRQRTHNCCDENDGIPAPSFSKFRSPPQSTPGGATADSASVRRIDVIQEEFVGFTPGTKFVAELARLMNLEVGHHAPLSVIIDKHWDKLKFHFRDDTEY